MPVDLHLHTHYSDGTWSPSELIDNAIALKLRHIAVTDHDTIDGVAEAAAAAAGRLEVIPGIELSTVWRSASGPEQDVHILGYYVDERSPALKEIMQRQRQFRLTFVEETIERLAKLGINLTADAVRAASGKGSIGRPHVTRAIVAAGGAATVEQAYEKFMRRDSAFYIPRQAVTPEEAIEAINLSGGIASLAHPGKTSQTEELVAELKSFGLAALEAFHRSHSLPRVKQYMRLAASHGLIITGGSDCHGPFEDYPPSIGSVRVPLQTVRNLEALIAAKRGCLPSESGL